MNIIRRGVFSEKFLCYTSTVKVEEKGLPSVIYRKKERKKGFGIIWKIFKS